MVTAGLIETWVNAYKLVEDVTAAEDPPKEFLQLREKFDLLYPR